MHYRLAPGIVVKTENAAKPAKQKSSFLSSQLAQLPHVSATLDYGCGKLRYTNEMLDITDTLTLVDSEIQLSRQQTLRGESSSIRSLFKRANRVSVLNEQEFGKSPANFDRAFCINVLSVIPSYSKRREVLGLIRKHLQPDARCLFVVQYRNSDFDRMRVMPNARPWRDGFLVDSLRGYSFYGLISPERLIAALRRAEYQIESSRLNEGSIYVWAGR